ncbi:MAG: hypothetical protein E6J90_40395 [Deltaproteobacteria bacterium]|nr:MAG: hypothetical protein E6J90_40395 [Deltaproteobacteria bacterium]
MAPPAVTRAVVPAPTRTALPGASDPAPAGSGAHAVCPGASSSARDPVTSIVASPTAVAASSAASIAASAGAGRASRTPASAGGLPSRATSTDLPISRATVEPSRATWPAPSVSSTLDVPFSFEIRTLPSSLTSPMSSA